MLKFSEIFILVMNNNSFLRTKTMYVVFPKSFIFTSAKVTIFLHFNCGKNVSIIYSSKMQ